MNWSMNNRWFWCAGGVLFTAIVLVCVGCPKMAPPTDAPKQERSSALRSTLDAERVEGSVELPVASTPKEVENISPSAAPSLAVAPFDAATAKSHQEAWAEHLGVEVEIENSIGMRLVLIPPGEFMMGLPASEGLGAFQHRVRITKPFYFGMYEVTQVQWERVMGNNPSHFKGPDRPVERVRWEDCKEFIRRLNGFADERGGVYRLPTEAEWEYACRAGSTTAYSFGDSIDSLDDYAWHYGNSGERTHPVGQKRPNAWALYDIHGNAKEWCEDWYDFHYYANSPVDDPQGPERGSFRVKRGGCWAFSAPFSRSAYKDTYEASDRIENLGFRLARTVSYPSR